MVFTKAWRSMLPVHTGNTLPAKNCIASVRLAQQQVILTSTRLACFTHSHTGMGIWLDSPWHLANNIRKSSTPAVRVFPAQDDIQHHLSAVHCIVGANPFAYLHLACLTQQVKRLPCIPLSSLQLRYVLRKAHLWSSVSKDK